MFQLRKHAIITMMSIPDGASVPMTPYRHPIGLLATSQISFSTPGPCTIPYYFGTTTLISAEAPGKSSRKQPNGKKNCLQKKKNTRPAIADLPTYKKLQLFYGFLHEELKWTYGKLLFCTSQDFSGIYSGPTSHPCLISSSLTAAFAHHLACPWKVRYHHP
jgi:hypothetical protein